MRPSLFNEAVDLDDDGFRTIGSAWSAAFRLDEVTLAKQPGSARESAVPLWGTWARETLEPNTTLRVMSSDRFAHDGSLTNGFVEDVTLDYCDPSRTTIVCVAVTDLKPGYGQFDDGPLYHWNTGARTHPAVPSAGVTLDTDDTFELGFVGLVSQVTVETTRKRTGVSRIWRSIQRLLRGRDDVDVLKPALRDDRTSVLISGHDTKGSTITRICWAPGHGWPDWAELNRRGGSMTNREYWTVPESERLLEPNEQYELRVRYTAILRAPDSAETTPLGAPASITAPFTTGGPPARADALANYVAHVQPSDGARPVYTGYDLRVQFVEDYVPYLYASVGERLMIRLFDGQGEPLLDAAGQPLLLAATELAPEEKSTAQQVWEDILRRNVARGCVNEPGLRTESETALRVDAGSVTLTPNSQYTAQLVSDARPGTALVSWGFTTARFATFTDLAIRDRRLAPLQVVAGTPTANDFDSLARELGLPSVRYVETLTATPLLRPAGDRCVAVLLESPEPLESGTRLSVTVDGTTTTAVANADTTRVILRRSGASWPLAVLPVRLTWRRDAGAALPRLTVAGVADDEVVAFDLDARST